MISIIFFIHDPFHIILADFTSFLLTETQLFVTSFYTSSYLFAVIFCPFTSLSIPSCQFFNSVSASSTFSLLFNLLSLLSFSCFYTYSYSPQYYSDILCASFFLGIASFKSSFQHHISRSILPLFLPHTSQP